MSLEERVFCFILGASVGFILGYIVARLREIKEELDEVVDIERKHDRDESGLFKTSALNLAVIFVVLITAWAAFSSQRATNNSRDTQTRVVETQMQVVRLTLCNQEFLAKTILALNARTKYTISQTNANLDLQKSQQEFLTLIIQRPRVSEDLYSHAAQKYLRALRDFIKISEKQKEAVVSNPYPTNQEFSNCLSGKTKPEGVTNE